MSLSSYKRHCNEQTQAYEARSVVSSANRSTVFKTVAFVRSATLPNHILAALRDLQSFLASRRSRGRDPAGDRRPFAEEAPDLERSPKRVEAISHPGRSHNRSSRDRTRRRRR